MLLAVARERHLAPAMQTEFALCFEGRLSQELTACGVPVHTVGAVRTSRPWTVWRARRRLAALIRAGQHDVVICHMAWPAAVFGPVARKLRKPLVLWLHDYARGDNWIERWAKLTPPDVAICNSRFTESSLPNLYPRAASEVVWCPVSLAPSAPHANDEERRMMRKQFGADEQTTVILQVSRMEPWKGHELHLRALGRLRDLPGWNCWMVGGAQRPHEKEYQEMLVELAGALGIGNRVHFLGQRTDVSQLMAAADVFCQPNRNPEPFGIVFIEAMNAGLPVVSSAFGGALEVIDSSCGYLVPPGDAAALAERLQHLIEAPLERARLGQHGPARARSLTDPSQQLGKLNRIIERLTGTGRDGNAGASAASRTTASFL